MGKVKQKPQEDDEGFIDEFAADESLGPSDKECASVSSKASNKSGRGQGKARRDSPKRKVSNNKTTGGKAGQGKRAPSTLACIVEDCSDLRYSKFRFCQAHMRS